MNNWVKAGVLPGALLLLCACSGGGNDSQDPPTPPPVVNTPPTADAGSDQVVNAGSVVSLSGAGSVDANGSIATYAWTQTNGSNVTLTGANTATPTFTAPASGSLAFQLTVTDNHGASHSDSVTITVTATPPPPPPSAPVIARQPTSPASTEHGSALIFVVASGTDLNYEWRSHTFGTILKSGPEPWLMRTGLGMNDDGNCYRVEISNSLGSVTSEPGCISVQELQTDLDPYKDEDDGLGQDDQEYALAFGNTLLRVAQLASGGLTGPSLAFFGMQGVMTGVPLNVGLPNPCYSGTHHGSTLDGVAVAAAVPVPIGRHSISEAWDECRANSDALSVSDGAILVDYDFPERYGEGSFTLYLSGYRADAAILNGIVRATLTTVGAGTNDRRDEIELVVEDDFSSPGLRIDSGIDQTISIRREYSEDETLMDDTTIDFEVGMSAYDIEGPAGSIFRSAGTNPRLRWVVEPGDSGDPSHFSNETFSVGLTGGFHLATLQAGYGVMGWEFDVLPGDQCPEGYVCVDPPSP